MAGDRLLQLMQLGDSALPSGGYAFSNGLEAAHKTGLITDVRSFEQCLVDQLFQVRQGELPFVHSCFTPKSLTREYFVDLVAFYDATQLAPAIRKGSEILGRNWVRLMTQLEGEACVAPYKMWMGEAGLPTHLTPIFGATMRGIGVSEEEAMQLFCHQVIRDQISSAIRLGICGPMEAARIHRQVLPACDDLAADRIPYQEASRWLIRWDLAQCQHDQLYTRLFQN